MRSPILPFRLVVIFTSSPSSPAASSRFSPGPPPPGNGCRQNPSMLSSNIFAIFSSVTLVKINIACCPSTSLMLQLLQRTQTALCVLKIFRLSHVTCLLARMNTDFSHLCPYFSDCHVWPVCLPPPSLTVPASSARLLPVPGRTHLRAWRPGSYTPHVASTVPWPQYAHTPPCPWTWEGSAKTRSAILFQWLFTTQY